MGVFFTTFEKMKKDIFARNFFKMGPMDLKMCAKKTCNRSGSSPKILSKSDHFSKIYDIFKQGHFLFDPTVRSYQEEITKIRYLYSSEILFLLSLENHPSRK